MPEFDGVYLLDTDGKLKELEASKEIAIKGRKPTAGELGARTAMDALDDPRFGKNAKIYGFKKGAFKVKIDAKTFFEKGFYVQFPKIHQVRIGKSVPTDKDKSSLCHDDSAVSFHRCKGGNSGFKDEVMSFRSKEVKKNLRFLKAKKELPSGSYFIWIQKKESGGFSEGYPFIVE